MRIQLMRDVSRLGIGAQHETADARPVTKRVAVEFRKGVSRALRMLALPPLNHFGLNVVIPATPIIPGDEDRCFGPEPAVTTAFTCSTVQRMPSVTFCLGCSD